jgi:hypothetical protein
VLCSTGKIFGSRDVKEVNDCTHLIQSAKHVQQKHVKKINELAGTSDTLSNNSLAWLQVVTGGMRLLGCWLDHADKVLNPNSLTACNLLSKLQPYSSIQT